MNALPSHKPTRLKRLALRFAALVVAVSAPGAAYWFTRPPELVWWRSPEIGKTGRTVRVLVPNGWELDEPPGHGRGLELREYYILRSPDKTPSFLQGRFPRTSETTVGLGILIRSSRIYSFPQQGRLLVGEGSLGRNHWHYAKIAVTNPPAKIFAQVECDRTNRPAFNRTYRQICDSLRID